MKDFDSSLVHSSWIPVFEPHISLINSILQQIDGRDIAPSPIDIFRAFRAPLDSIKCLIIGQDPYPTKGHAVGLAFSTAKEVTPLPKSLQNIYKELQSDIGVQPPQSGDLSYLVDQGVMLLNRILTTEIGTANAHAKLGWQTFTDSVARILGARDVVAILWGKQAQELSHHFRYRIESAHPSPLSSYRGFFGSKPFSRANEILVQQGKAAINW